MTDRTIAVVDLTDNALSLLNALSDLLPVTDAELADIYVTDCEGRCFKMAELIEETLTDGSKVYNLVLLPMAGEN
jgi:hypothetical protein